MTEAEQLPLYRDYPSMFEGPVKVLAVEGGRVIPDRSLFYPAGGGQPGDSGVLEIGGREIRVADTVKAGTACALVLAEGETPPEPGAEGVQRLDEERRRRHMRMHTALHLLSVAIPLPVTGGQIGAEKSRLDFDMPEAPEDKETLEANPGLVKTMSVKPPMGQGRVRLVRIGAGETPVDLQPCGGTHVRTTGEIGRVRIGKIEKKGKRNRRVNLHLEG
jgi:misacylated tRNA(Ala) deacylase